MEEENKFGSLVTLFKESGKKIKGVGLENEIVCLNKAILGNF